MTIGENIISSVSAPLANTIFSSNVEAQTFESLKGKTAELLVALDVIASATHDLETLAQTAIDFKESFENTERRMIENEKATLNSLPSIAPGTQITEDEKENIIQSIDTVKNGTVTQVTDLNGTTYGNLVPKTYVSDMLQEEESFQEQLLTEALNVQQSQIRQPLNAITTLQRLKGGTGGADPDLSVSIFASPKFIGSVEAKDFQSAEKFIVSNGLSTAASKGYIPTALSRSAKNEEIKMEHAKKQETKTASAPKAQQAPQVMVMSGGGGGAPVFTGGGGAPRQAASFNRSGGAFSRRGGSRYERPGQSSTGVITTTDGPIAPPTQGTFTSGFGPRWGTNHNGIDIAAPIGTPIYAAKDGVVIDSGPAQGFGNWIRIQHDDGTITTYGHMSTLSAQVGDEVQAGDYIAGMGSEGQSTGSHLHFEVTDPSGNKVDPLPWLHAHGITDWG